MKHDLEQFSAACRAILKQDPGVEGRKRVCALVEDVLKDDEFIKTYLTDDVPERQVLYGRSGARLLHPRPRLSRSQGQQPARSWSLLGDLRPSTRRDRDDRLRTGRTGERRAGWQSAEGQGLHADARHGLSLQRR